jgi:ribosomal protein S20
MSIKEQVDQSTPEQKEIIKTMTKRTLEMVKNGDTSGALKYLQSIKKKYEPANGNK